MMATLSAASRIGDECGIMAPFRWNVMFCRVRHFVFFSFAFGTCRYSQDRHAKRKAPMMSFVVACRISVVSFSAAGEYAQQNNFALLKAYANHSQIDQSERAQQLEVFKVAEKLGLPVDTILYFKLKTSPCSK